MSCFLICTARVYPVKCSFNTKPFFGFDYMQLIYKINLVCPILAFTRRDMTQSKPNY